MKNISNSDNTSAFEECSLFSCCEEQDYVYCLAQNISYRLSMDASSSSQEMLKQHVSELVNLLKTFDYISVAFFDSVTYSELASPKRYSDILLSLSIPEVHNTVTSCEEVHATLPLLLSWVSLLVGNRCPVKRIKYSLRIKDHCKGQFILIFGGLKSISQGGSTSPNVMFCLFFFLWSGWDFPERSTQVWI